jgi:signal transduction histidine kinase/ligand-binding sensor domain-containing protein
MCCICNYNTLANENYIFEQISTSEGLSSGTVYAVLKDSRGFMWFSTDDGLNRYDGYTFKQFNAKNPEWQINKSLQFLNLVEDRYGRIWIATSEGLYFFDRNNEKIVHFLDHSGLKIPLTLINETINTLFYDSRDYLWIGSYNGIVRIKITENMLSTTTNDVAIFLKSGENDYQIFNNQVFSITEDNDRKIWIASNSEYLECYDYKSDSITKYRIEIPGLTKWNFLNKRISIDNLNNLWIATQGMGAIYWDRQNNTFTQTTSININNEQINTSLLRTIMIDSSNRVWFGTDGNGIIIYDKANNKTINYRSDTNNQSRISSNAIYTLYEDDKNNFWVGTYLTGINKVAVSKLNFGVHYSVPNSNNHLNNKIVTNICEDQNGLIWLSTDGGGLNIYDQNTKSFRHLMHKPNNKNSLSINTAIALFCDNDNKMWVGTYNGGLNIYDQEHEKFKHYRFNPNDTTSISSDHVWGFEQDQWGNMWIATVSSGINLMKKGSDSFIRYQITDINYSGPDQITSNAITYLFIDNKHRLWIATEWGLDMIELKKVNFNDITPKLHFNHIINPNTDSSIKEYRISYVTQDTLGNIWVGTKGAGLIKINSETLEHNFFTINEGLPHNVITGILTDNNNLWISTNHGLSNFNIETQQFRNYDASYGLQSNVFMKTACLKASNGIMFFGGINGFNAFNPNEIVIENDFFLPIVTDFMLFNQSVQVGNKQQNSFYLEKSIIETKHIDLNYKNNNLTFEFSALDYANAEKISYLYKLEGFDNEWNLTNSKIRIAKYTNLNPGKYTFMLKASSQQGYWPNYHYSLPINIEPPWWRTKLFIISSIVFGIMLLLFIYYYRVRSLKMQQIILQNTVDKKTKQLQIMNRDLENAIQTKDKFLSIVAHDLINPFNSIMGFSDVLLSNYNNMNDNHRIETIEIINNASNELFDLLDNLLQWSRSERGLLEFTPQKTDLKSAIDKSISLVNLSSKIKNINIEKHLPLNKCITIADERMLNTVLRNLLSNAIKFTPNGGQIIVAIEQSNNQYSISIIDNGIGISAENIEKLLEKNIKFTTSGTNNEKGTGLGLVLVKELIEKQNGTLKVESTEGKGSTFTFSLPVWNEQNEINQADI